MKNVIETFYKAFNELDAETMASCYHDDVVFEDPAFGILNGYRAINMWKMLCDSQKNNEFKVLYSDVIVNENKGSATWEAFYTFSKTQRKVHNIIHASFEFKDGKIIKHTDKFNLYRWSKQALGFKGFLMGNTKFFKNKLQLQTNKLLDRYEKTKLTQR